MEKKTPEEIAKILDKTLGKEPYGSDLSIFLNETIKESGYSDPSEIESIKKAVRPIFLELRSLRRAS